MNARPTTSSSNIHRRRACPGSRAAEEGRPEDRSAEADEGTLLHAHAAQPGLSRAALNDEQRAVLGRCEEIEREALARIIAEEHLEEEPFEVGTERELWLHRGLKAIYPGHCDYWRYYPRRKILIIFDRKFGRIAVELAKINDQLRSYAVQGAEEWECVKVYAGIIQPRLYGDDARSLVVYDAGALRAARADLLRVWDACHAPDAARHASEDACRYCKAAVDCEERNALVTGAVPLAQLPAVQLTAEQLGTCLVAIELLSDKWVEEIKGEARRRIEAGTLPDWKLKGNAPRRTIKSPYEAIRRLLESGFTKDEILAQVTLPVGGATKLYTLKNRTPAEAKTALEAVLGDCLATTEIAPSIVRAA